MKRPRLLIFTILLLSILLFSPFIPPHSKLLKVKTHAQTSISKAECVMEVNSKRVLYEDGGDVRLPMASTTKIVTCITVLELCNDIQEEVKIPQNAVGIEGSSVYLKEGEIYTVEDLLYGLMLRSGNDCAIALALHCCDSVPIFCSKMNELTQKAGALHSNFENPHGLPSKNHYTTARDLTMIASYAMQNPTFAKIVSTKKYEKQNWVNKNKLLQKNEEIIGIKTGYTKEAGRCLVTAMKRGEATLVCTVLNSPTMYERTSELLEDAFSQYKYTHILEKDSILEIENGKTKGKTDKSFYYPLLPEEKSLIVIKTYATEKKDIYTRAEKIVGRFEIYLAKQLLFSGNLYKL